MRNKNIQFTIVSFLFLALLSACSSIPNAKIEGTDSVDPVAGQIADFDLPSGFSPEFSVHMQDYSLAAYHPGDGISHLYLLQSTKEADGKILDKVLGKLTSDSVDIDFHTIIIETQSVTVRSQDITLIISEGLNSDGISYRQALAAFEGKGGPAVIVFSRPVTGWDQQQVEALIASIH